MSSISVAGDTSGSISITAPLVAGSGVLTLPVATDTLVGKATTDTLTNKTLTAPVLSGSVTGTYTLAGTPTMGASVLTSATAQASTSGTSIDFTGIPSWVKRITVMFNGVSTNGTSNPQVQLGDSGGIETTGYLGSSSIILNVVGSQSYTSGFVIGGSSGNWTSSKVAHGAVTITNISGNNWVAFGAFGGSDAGYTLLLGGSKSLSDVLTQVRITTVNGTDTFDAGSINIIYE